MTDRETIKRTAKSAIEACVSPDGKRKMIAIMTTEPYSDGQASSTESRSFR